MGAWVALGRLTKLAWTCMSSLAAARIMTKWIYVVVVVIYTAADDPG